MGIIVVDICHTSLINILNIEELEEEYPEVAVLKTDCLSSCGTCRLRPFAIVNNKRIFAKTPEECLERIKEQIEKELAYYA